MAFELITLVALVLLLEGLVLALMPGAMRRLMAAFAALEQGRLRTIGLATAIAAAVFLVLLAHLAGGGGDTAELGFSRIRAFIAGLM